jgi:hypothetical protein
MLSLLAIGWLGGDATGSPEARQRVVLSDADLELRHAMERALAPWRLQIVIDGSPPRDAASARARADVDGARFVVWRDEDELVIYDRELGSTERRPSQSGELDAPTAAAAALTIKTMMRLPPPEDEPPVALAPVGGRGSLRVQAGLASRIARSDVTDVSTRFGGTVTLRPWSASGWRFGLSGDVGTAMDVDRAGFKGTWSEWAVLAVSSWTLARGAWEIEPHAGIGLRSSSLDGAEMGEARSETALLATVRGGVWARWRHARLTLGVAVDADAVLDAPTYTKLGAPAVVFQVPGAAIEVGAVIALDLGRWP